MNTNSDDIGAVLLQACMHYVRETGGTTLWCNARTTVAGFYQRFGFAVKGDVFELPDLGPHVLMECACPSR